MIRNVVFDWSGTLVDDMPGVLAAMKGISEDLGGEPLTEEIFRTQFKLPLEDFFKERWPEATLGDLLLSYLRHFPSDDPSAVSLFPGRVALLEKLAGSGRRLAICSSAPRAHVEAQAKAMGVFDRFEVIWAGVLDKQAELPGLLEEWNADPSETLFAGDMSHDVGAGKAAKVMMVATPSRYEPVEALLKAGPDLLMPDLNRLAEVIGDAPRFSDVFPVATVGALILNGAGRMLLVRTHKWSDRWGIPGGKIQRGESSETALRRELREETGLEVSDVRFVLVQDCIEPPEFERSAHFLLMNYTARHDGPDEAVRLNDEAEEWTWVSLDEALEMDLNAPTRFLIEACVEKGIV